MERWTRFNNLGKYDDGNVGFGVGFWVGVMGWGVCACVCVYALDEYFVGEKLIEAK